MTILKQPTEKGMNSHMQMLENKLEQTSTFLQYLRSEWFRKKLNGHTVTEQVWASIPTCLLNLFTKCSNTSI